LVVIDQEPRIDSRLIAQQLGVEHESFRKLVYQYQADFEEFGILRFEIGEIKGRGQPEKYALLNEDQSYLGLTYTQNTEQARTLKKKLVRTFGDYRRKLATQATPNAPLTLSPVPAHTGAQVLKTPKLAVPRNVIAVFLCLSDWFCSYGQGGLVRKAGRTSSFVFSHPVRPAENRVSSLETRSISHV
jgi:hypothetical protein